MQFLTNQNELFLITNRLINFQLLNIDKPTEEASLDLSVEVPIQMAVVHVLIVRQKPCEFGVVQQELVEMLALIQI